MFHTSVSPFIIIIFFWDWGGGIPETPLGRIGCFGIASAKERRVTLDEEMGKSVRRLFLESRPTRGVDVANSMRHVQMRRCREVCICLVVYAIQRSLYLVSHYNNIKNVAATLVKHSENLPSIVFVTFVMYVALMMQRDSNLDHLL